MGKLADKTRKMYRNVGANGAHAIADIIAKNGDISKEEVITMLGQFVGSGLDAATLLVDVAAELDKLEEILNRIREIDEEIVGIKKLLSKMDSEQKVLVKFETKEEKSE